MPLLVFAGCGASKETVRTGAPGSAVPIAPSSPATLFNAKTESPPTSVGPPPTSLPLPSPITGTTLLEMGVFVTHQGPFPGWEFEVVNAFRGPISGGTVHVLSGEDLLNHVAAVRVYDSSPASDGDDADYVGQFTVASVDAVATIESASGNTLAMSVEATPNSAVLTTGTFDLSTDTFAPAGS